MRYPPYSADGVHCNNAKGVGRSARRGNVSAFASTTICFSCEIYPRTKPLYIMFATRHSASSIDTSSLPAMSKPAWNVDTGMRVLLSAAIHLRSRKPITAARRTVSYTGGWTLCETYTRRNSPRIQSSLAFSRVSHRLRSTSLRSNRSKDASYARMSPFWMAVMKGVYRSSSTGKRRSSSFDGK